MIELTKYDVIIVGAGPAGLFAAIALGAQGKKVLVLEKNKEAGKKLLLSGSGQCNITQDGHIKDFANHYGDQYKYIKKSLQTFSNKDTVDFFEDRGLEMESLDSGKIFPKSRSARNILNLLLAECAKFNVNIHYAEKVTKVIKSKGCYTIETQKDDYQSTTLIIATGGITYPKTGSTGDGFKIGLDLGHKIVKPLPALTPVEIEDYPFKELAGVSLKDLPFTVWRKDKKIKESRGDILFTHKGLSGPGILNNSRWMRGGDMLYLNFIKRANKKEFNKIILKEINKNGKEMIKTILRKQKLPRRLLETVLKHSEIPEETQCGQINKEDRSLLVESLVAFPLKISQLGGLHIAMVTSGGINMKQVNPTTMESRINKNLYFIGEVLDIDGDTGGYNIQAALSTAKLCADGIKRRGI